MRPRATTTSRRRPVLPLYSILGSTATTRRSFLPPQDRLCLHSRHCVDRVRNAAARLRHGGGGDILSCRIARSPTELKCAPEDRCCRRLLWGYETMTLRRWWPSCAQRITNHNRRRLKFQPTPSRLSTIHIAQNNSCPRAPPASSACDFPRIFSQVWNRNAQHSALEAPLAHCRECGESVFPSQVLMRAAPRRGGRARRCAANAKDAPPRPICARRVRGVIPVFLFGRFRITLARCLFAQFVAPGFNPCRPFFVLSLPSSESRFAASVCVCVCASQSGKHLLCSSQLGYLLCLLRTHTRLSSTQTLCPSRSAVPSYLYRCRTFKDISSNESRII